MDQTDRHLSWSSGKELTSWALDHPHCLIISPFPAFFKFADLQQGLSGDLEALLKWIYHIGYRRVKSSWRFSE